ncbi:MAG: histidine--tRNA ligase [Flavobacteriales bacterium]|nr:histidine--tRNA ligase [Flavobacteriales bacterium]
MVRPALLKGTRDFLPHQIAKREFIFDTIAHVYRKFGFQPIETPAMERSETLMGKYGEEGDRLIFRLLNNGDFMADVDRNASSTELASQISKRALRYDLTVPFARFVSQHRSELTFPFKRYQIQPVWRADRPQKGRYQEFYQCDADVVGSNSLLHEVEFILIFDEALASLGLNQVTIHLNNRKVLTGIAEVAGCADSFSDMAIVLDKLDKIGLERVEQEWAERGISAESVEVLGNFFKDSIEIGALEDDLKSSEIGSQGVKELAEVMQMVERSGPLHAELRLNLTLARGLDYYTGAIFEVTTDDHAIGSICGGGRYDDLTGTFGLSDMSGIGVSFGADRIYDVLEATAAWPEALGFTTQVMFVNFGEAEATHCMGLLRDLRGKGISSELYPSAAKMKKQMKYADDKGIPYVCLVGSEEMNSNTITVKSMADGSQETMDLEGLIARLDKGGDS